MANTKISDLTAGAAVAATDVIPNVQTAGAGPVKTTAAQIKTFTSASPTLVTPVLGVATGTSLALGGATLGSNALAVTGTGNFSSSITSGSTITAAGTGFIGFTGRSYFDSPSNGVFRMANSATTDFDRLQIGGTTDSFPAMARDGAGLKFTGAATGLTAWIKVPGVAVASLPAAATAGVGARAFVTDALTPTWGSTVVKGGAVGVPVYSDGTNWKVG